jgi:hypothetical protein
VNAENPKKQTSGRMISSPTGLPVAREKAAYNPKTKKTETQ